MTFFKIGQSSLDVCKVIVNFHKEISELTLIAHHVGVNWREINSSPEQKAKHLIEGLYHEVPSKVRSYSRDEFLTLSLPALPNLEEHVVWSIISKVKCSGGSIKHIPMMNFHPEGGIRLPEIVRATRHITQNHKGCFLETGRFFHYYGNFLLDPNEWSRFLGEFLTPCILVSPRYIAHRLHDGYCSLRLTSDKKYKPKIPQVIKII